MLGLFKEQERQISLQEGMRQRKEDQLMKEHFERLRNKDSFSENQYPGETVTNLKKSVQALQDKKCKQNIQKCEESLSQELGERKQNTHREEKMRQLLWETSPELRELRQKLLIADVTKDQAMQIAEKQAIAELRRKEEEALGVAALHEREKYEAEKKRRELQDFQDKLHYHRELDALRHFKKSKELGNELQLQRERNAVDEIKRQIEKEEKDIKQKKLEKQRELQRQAKELQQVREEIRLREKLKDKTQDLKADEYRKAQELRAKEQEEKKQFSLEQRLQLQEELLFYLESIYSEKLKQDVLRTELAVEEKEAAERKKESDTERKRMQIREELEHLYEMQIYVKKQKQDMEKKAEELYRQNLMAKLCEEDRLDLMSQQKRHQKKLEHMRAAQIMIEESRKKKAVERARELADQKFHDEIESKRKEMVKEEKLRFLRDHATELLGYLPKRVFKDDQTLDLLGEEFQKFYSRRNCCN